MSKKLTDTMLRKWAADKVVLNNMRCAAVSCLQHAMHRHQLGDEFGCFLRLFLFHFYRDEVLELQDKQAAEQAEFDVEAALLGEELL